MEIISLPADMANYYQVIFTGPGDGVGAKVMESDDSSGAGATELRYLCPARPAGDGFTVQVLADQCSKRYVTVAGATMAVGDLPRYASAPTLPSPGTLRPGVLEEEQAAKAKAAAKPPESPEPKPPPKPEPKPEPKPSPPPPPPPEKKSPK